MSNSLAPFLPRLIFPLNLSAPSFKLVSMTIRDANTENPMPPMHDQNQETPITPITPMTPILPMHASSSPLPSPSPSSSFSPRWASWLFWLAALAISFPIYGHFLLGNLPVGADNTLFYAPFFAMRWQGGPPLWNPYSLSGTALYDNLQSALLYPPRWPFYFVADWRDFFSLFVFLHYVIAAAGMAGLLRALGVRRLAALAGALLFAAGGHMAGRVINLTIFMGCCWLPWLLWGAAGRRQIHAWLTILGVAMIALIGSPHLLFYGLLAWWVGFVTWTLLPEMRKNCGLRIADCGLREDFEIESESTGGVGKVDEGVCVASQSAIQVRRPSEPSRPQSAIYSIRNPQSAIRILSGRLLALALGLILAAPTLIPGVMRSQASIRTKSTIASNLADSVAFPEIVPTLLGGTGGAVYPEYIDKSCYIGPVALALILWLMLRRASWRDRRFLGALGLVGVGFFFALGKNVGVQFILPWLPVVRNLAGAPRALVVAAAGLAVLVALALDALTARRTRRLGALFAVAGLAALIFYGFHAFAAGQAADEPGFAAQMARAWAVAPAVPDRLFYPALDAAWGLLAAALILLLPPASDRLRQGLLAGLLFALCWHFAPRVLPPTERRPFFEPPPQVALVQAEQARATQAPFRVAGYDPLRVHDAQFESPNKFKFLAPNIATVFHVEDITGFDPLMYLRYLDLFLATSGRAPYNDPIRNLDLGRPDPALFDFLGLRFILGNPYDRRLCHLPLTLAPGQPIAEVGEWTPAKAEGRAVTHWLIVSLLDRALRVPLGAEVARLVIEADEGTFEFPIRNGLETADLHALNFEPLYKSPAFRAQLNLPWGSNTLDPELHYRVSAANYRAVIPFGRPLHVRRAAWRLLRPDLIFSIAAQAFRIAPAPQDPWALRYGLPDEPAPVFEYTAAKPRAVLVSNPSSSQVPGTPPERITSASRSVSAMDVQLTTASLNQPSAPGTLEWLDRSPCAMTLHVKSERPSLLVLREMWDRGWKAEVNGQTVPVQRVNGLLRGVAVPAGESLVRLAYRPRLPLALLALAGLSLISYVIGLSFWHRQN